MKARLVGFVASAALLLSAGETFARAPGDPEKGELLARESCSACHAIDRSSQSSPNPLAPPFRQIARTPGMNALALRAALQTSHRNMPNLVLGKGSREDVIAYILELKTQHPAPPARISVP
jgi:mono/diheme cytochrome c family protein